MEVCIKAGVPVPPEPCSDLVEATQPLLLPAAGGDRWSHSARVFAQMLTVVKGEKQRADAAKLLDTIRSKVSTLGDLRAAASKEQNALSVLEAKSREGRQRFGNAVEGLGEDASHAREEARASREHAEHVTIASTVLRDEVRELHADVVLWEGRCAFEEPQAALVEAYHAIANAMDRWCAAGEMSSEADRNARELESVVTDLEYQIGELRAGLVRLETASEQERGDIERRTTTLARQADALEHELLELATRYCRPLRDLPGAAVFFQQLNDGGT